MRSRFSAFLASALVVSVLSAQVPYYSSIKPDDRAREIPANSGAAALWQLLQKLHTRASLIMITAHPDDEDGGTLTYESRGRGTRVSLLTLNRGEGGANVMSPDYFDALGLVRTMELLDAGLYYGVDQYWTRLVDYGFSKTKAEALGRWTHDRVLYDAVRVVRMVRPLVVTSVFVGGDSDGHGNHQVAGQMAKEVFDAAADPNVFPEQIKAGLRPWKPLKYYARAPFSRRGGASPVAINLEIPVGNFDPLLGASYVQLAREGLGFQRSQTGGPSVPLAGKQASSFHRYGSVIAAQDKESSFFDGIDTSLPGIASLAGKEDAAFLVTRLNALNKIVEEAIAKFSAQNPSAVAPILAKGMKETDAMLAALAGSSLSAGAKADIKHELDVKKAQFNHALAAALGISVSSNVAPATAQDPMMAMFRGQPDTFRMALPGQSFAVRLHVANQSGAAVMLTKTSLQTPDGEAWTVKERAAAKTDLKTNPDLDVLFDVQVPENGRYTRPYFVRPNIEQPYYDIPDERYLGQPISPYPVAAWADFEFEGAAFRVGQVVQTTQRTQGLGTVSEPLAVGPAFSVAINPRAGVIPLGTKSFPLSVSLLSNVKGEAAGTVRLELPTGWQSSPVKAEFKTTGEGANQSVQFTVTPGALSAASFDCTAVVEYAGKQYREGYQLTGYAGLRPYFLYRPASHKTSGVDVKVAPGLRVGYITGTGDEVPESLGNLGIKPTFVSSTDLAGGDLSRFDVILLGVRAYAAREDVKTYNTRLLDYVSNGGVVIVQYNTPEFDRNYGPFPYQMGPGPEEVTDEESEIEILDPANPIFNWPNKITDADFKGWVEERGSKFLRSWDAKYTPLLSTNDEGQPPQKGGLLFARHGKGIYIYNAYAFYRQLPEGVGGAYRIFANMVSLSKAPK